ncbi:hypothetical protein BJ508DRAFT_154872 [Ascobolus immersus RN42]|uniref:Uncharacterized protein n=1 Tax=Ascobolus immersus RN42 TaxID=1160509 RepID=A0A3N4IA57_ASCIM|nr:hypothetical protein BJ508DRAFT_154872 [Ascobolus immersus RN42]
MRTAMTSMPKGSPAELQRSLEEGESLLVGGETRRKSSRTEQQLVPSSGSWIPWMVHAVLITGYLLLIIHQWRKDTSCLLSKPSHPEVPVLAKESTDWVIRSFDNGHGENRIIRHANGTEEKKRILFYKRFPDADVDKAWKDLYEEVMYVRLSKDEAKILPQETIWLDDDSGYLSGLDIFHQLHCLDAIRQALYPEEDKILKALGPEGHSQHLGHCINYIRQQIVCTAESIPLTLHTDPAPPPGGERFQPDFANPHVCRNFEKIYDWAYERRMKVRTPSDQLLVLSLPLSSSLSPFIAVQMLNCFVLQPEEEENLTRYHPPTN